MPVTFDLTGKVALVVGGHGGIGKAIALGLADAGADVVVASRSVEPLKAAAKEIQAKGRKSLAVSVDIVDIKSVSEMIDTVTSTFPRIDILINAAGLAIRKPAETFPIEEFNQVMDVNVTGTFTVCQAVGKIMIQQKSGSILNLSSVRGDHGLRANYSAYCTSKGAVNTLTKTLACEFAKYNVRVNAIAPTMVETDLTKDALKDPTFAKNMMASIPMGRWAMPEDMVGSAIFFAADASNFVTGQILYVDGGVDAD
jgi:NAD(P)-dependent dehydrogenase (short-subunit alcohol dehydrogenase family)